MRGVILFALCLTLCGCKLSEAEILERKYRRSVEMYGQRKSCADEHIIAEAWAREGNWQKYSAARIREAAQCQQEQAGIDQLPLGSTSATKSAGADVRGALPDDAAGNMVPSLAGDG
ncbi:hypothetical protein V475_21385 [Sphingobium baderi LL03]|uniref:Lipoprotein n=1 Tax=Sphingobium baderi LL03 TaxID=1114964 RepID=T0GE88_9SPHN|nr:hypothetical protein L485_08730 [Sphingobium baderi LL03]KMS54452.1 hypothetical protein V475_21385 [Sphingobium baderi LL03]